MNKTTTGLPAAVARRDAGRYAGAVPRPAAAGAAAPASDDDDTQALLRSALRLKRAAESGGDPPLLKEAHIAVLGAQPAGAHTQAFEAAAQRLGARVSHLPGDAAAGAQAAGAARMLGRLYDAIECDDLPDELAQRLQREAGVPVFHGWSRPDAALQRLLRAAQQDPRTDALGADADRIYLLQALLVAAIG